MVFICVVVGVIVCACVCVVGFFLQFCIFCWDLALVPYFCSIVRCGVFTHR